MISCPARDRYDVVVSEILAKKTLSEIQNEIQGEDDSVNPDDSEVDRIRRITVDNVKVTNVKRSYEVSKTVYRTAVIVVSKNETSGAAS